MTVATSPRPKPEAIPDHPGVYLFRDRDGRVIYVGKAISLRKRTASYFQPMRNLHPRTAAMVEGSASLEWVLVQSEVEALQLEYNLIKQHRPRYNVRYRDDKSYPWLAVPLADEIPRPRVERGPRRKGTRYFGPYAHAYAIRETLDLLLRTFPMRTCSKGVFDRHRRLGRPCILYDIHKCSGPCVGNISPEDHRRIVEDFVAFMDGRTRPTLQRLEAEMRQAAEQLNFELAARLRDQLASVRKAMERQQMVSSTPEDFDIAAFAEDDLEAAVQVFFVRRGRVVGRRGFVVDKVEALDTPALAATFVQQLYGDRADEVPREIFLPVEPEGAEALRAWLAGLRGRERPEQMATAVRFSKLAAPVLGLVAVTGLSRALHLAGGWQGLLDSNYGHFLDVKVALFLGLVLLGALNRYRIVPALSGGVRRLDELRRNVRGEVVLAACILAVTAVLSQLPPGKFVVDQAAAKPPAPPSLQVEGSDFATSVRVALTVSPGTTGPNAFTAKITDYDSGEDWPATRVALRFTPRDQPDIGASTLDLKRADDGLWRGQGSQLSIAGRWVVVGLIEGSGPAVTVPMELRIRAAPQQVRVSEVPGQPTLYTVTLAAGDSLQGYVDPGRPGPNTVHFTFFNRSGDEQPVDRGRARMTTSAGSEALTLIRLGPGHFAANIDLEPGRVSFAIDATAARTRYDGGFQQLIQ